MNKICNSCFYYESWVIRVHDIMACICKKGVLDWTQQKPPEEHCEGYEINPSVITADQED